ncbi:hypothetical protein [Paracidovorax cattleyae]|uniref:hypothetical protein n=1 Tax=Paracidovorax cattleyae TaxID=80868 RepID=UPI0018B00C08|nr:hypothetical protein [Paracidovorax cattleyae]MBF9266223.1 hypothetical protein [Paracidovorax cattleyae]
MRRWALAWLCLLLGMGVFDFYLPFYPFSLHAALAVAAMYAEGAAGLRHRTGYSAAHRHP